MTNIPDLQYHYNKDIEMCQFCKEYTVMCQLCGWCWCTRTFISKHLPNNGRCSRCQDLFFKINIPIYDKEHCLV